jgi:pimeloyl-ACP methyl ester carboxylesterase
MAAQIFFIHGMWSRPWVWDRWKRHFERAGYPCTAVTLPGHDEGQNDDGLCGLGIADYVEAVTKEAARFDRPILIGHSMGGLIAQKVAAQTPVSALVLVNSAAPGQIFPLRPGMLPGLTRHFSCWGLWRKSFRLSRWEADYLVLNGIPKPQRAQMYQQMIAESGRVAYELGFGRLNWTGSNRVDVSAIVCPVLALAGVRDRIIPIAVSRRLARLDGPKAAYLEFKQHAHWMLEEPGADERAHDVLGWLRQQEEVHSTVKL